MSTHDLTGLRCPQPLLALQRMAKASQADTCLTLLVDDPVAWGDIHAWCLVHHHRCKLSSPLYTEAISSQQPYQIEIKLTGKKKS
jgi:TusA-related sulfurtransferase